MEIGGLGIQLNISTSLIQPLLLVARVQQRYVELTGMTTCRLTWMLIACYSSCKKSGKNVEAGLGRQKNTKHLSIKSYVVTFWPH